MQQITASELSINVKKLLDSIQEIGKPIVIVRNSKAIAALVSLRDLAKIDSRYELFLDDDVPSLLSYPEQAARHHHLASRRFSDNVQNLVDLWNSWVQDERKRVTVISPGRRRAIRRALKLMPERRDWEEILRKIEQSSFLKSRPFVTFDWLVTARDKNGVEFFAKIKEGHYDDGQEGDAMMEAPRDAEGSNLLEEA
jgi:prevent-host-death family protein